MVHGQELPTAYVHAKFEDRSLTRLRNIEGVPKFRNWVTYPRPRQLRGPICGPWARTAHGLCACLSDDTINLINYQLTLLISYKLLSSY